MWAGILFQLGVFLLCHILGDYLEQEKVNENNLIVSLQSDLTFITITQEVAVITTKSRTRTYFLIKRFEQLDQFLESSLCKMTAGSNEFVLVSSLDYLLSEPLMTIIAVFLLQSETKRWTCWLRDSFAAGCSKLAMPTRPCGWFECMHLLPSLSNCP